MTQIAGLVEHVEAMEAAAASGEPLTQEEYMRALTEGSAERLLREVGGYAEEAELVVTSAMLFTRQQQILVEEGYDLGALIPEHAQRATLAMAVRELGPVGSVRRDAEAVKSARRERIVDDAIAARKIAPASREVTLASLERDPELEVALASMKPNPMLVKFSDVSPAGVVTLPDDTGLGLVVRAEAWLERKGKATRNPVTHELEGYDERTYLEALGHAREEMVLVETKADLKARGVAESKWRDENGDETKAYAEARRAAELRVDGRAS